MRCSREDEWGGFLSDRVWDGEYGMQGPLTSRDKALIRTLKSGPLQEDEAVIAELDAMLEMDAKAEIEALYDQVGIDGFSEALAHDMVLMGEQAIDT